MRALYVIIMTAFWCNIFYFVTSCVSYSSATSIVKFSYGDRIIIKFDMYNMGQATSYSIFESFNKVPGSYLFKSSGIINNSSFVTAEYNESSKKYNADIKINLLANEFHCSGRNVVQLTLDTGINPENPCTRREGCTIPVNWNNECVEPPPEITSTSINDDNKKSKNYYHSILISKKNYPFNNFFSYDEGDNATISFETDYTSFYMKWIQKMDNQIIMEGSENTDHNTLIQMIISRFDNGTTFQCFVYQAYGGDNRYSRLLGQSGIITINVRNTTSYETTTAIPEETVPYYDHAKLTCSGVNYKKWIKLSKDGLIEKVQNATLLSHQRGLDELILSLSLNETFNNSKYMCSGMTYSIGYHKREIVKLVHLVYDPMKSYDIESYSTEATELTDMKFILSNNIPLIAGVAGVVAVIFLIALIYLCLRKKKPRRPAPHEVETYACPSTVQYVQVQTVSTKSNRRLVKDDTPYARIIGCIEPAARR